jgi:hypothetical protein
VHAISHYKNLDRTIPELKISLVHAIKTVASDSGIIYDHPPEKLTPAHVDPGIQERSSITSIKSMAQEQKPEEFEEIIEVKELKEIDSVESIEELTAASQPQIPEETNEEPPKPEPKEIIASIIDQLDIGKGTSFSGVIEAAQKAGMEAEVAEAAIKDLMDEGRCYEPKIGTLRKV